MKWAYYNECDPFAAAWLREVIKAGLIADGEVDERSIADVRPADVRGFVQCHFFAGIGGWSYALRLAGWPDDRPAWTGSCPCQPFSSAGARAGGADSRDLWPTWHQLIAECKPAVIFGEQVEAAIGHGWLDRLCDDLEGDGYAVGAVGLPAACVGAPHIRQRLWFVADAERRAAERQRFDVGDATGGAQGAGQERQRLRADARHGESVGELADAAIGGQRIDGRAPGHAGHVDEREPLGFWSACDWIPCRDGKARPVEPKYVAVADGLPSDVVRGSDSREREAASWPTPCSADTIDRQTGMRPSRAATGRTTGYLTEAIRTYATPQIDGDGRPEVRTVQQDELQTARSPQGPEPGEQHAIELTDFVRLLPSSLAFAELHGHRATTEALHALLAASGAERLVQYPPHQIEAAWRSLSQEAQDRFRLEVGKGGFVRTVESPLVDRATARVGRLRGYGNAIVAPLAAAFIAAYCEVNGGWPDETTEGQA